MIELKEGIIPTIEHQDDYAIVSITKHGTEIARKLGQSFQNADIYYMDKFSKGDERALGIQTFTGSVRLLFPALFPQYRGLIIIISLGAVVRMIAPLLQDKKKDPAVVVIDDRGENVISVLSGHLGGANELTHEVAATLEARAIITTASDVQQTIPVDLFGKRFGWVWESGDKLTPVSAAVVNEEKIAIVQESGEKGWWTYDRPLPEQFSVYQSVAEALAATEQSSAALVISHRILTEAESAILENGVLYRPKVLVLGIGCNRGTSAAEIDAVIDGTLAELYFSKKSVKAIATIELKKDEVGLLELVKKYGWEFGYYSPSQLNTVECQQPSDTVFKYTGAYGVSEPAALLYSKARVLELVKKKSGNVTISVAVIPY